jgi:hypothetical protein
MSLDWDATRVENFEEKTNTDEGWAACQTIIFATISTNIGEITEENAREFLARYQLFLQLVGSTTELKEEETELKEEDVRKFVGLRTNVVTLTRKQWLNWFKGVAERELQSLMYRYGREAEKAAKKKDKEVQEIEELLEPNHNL